MYRRYLKRLADLILSFLLLLTLSWLFILIGLAYLLTNDLPVFFSQQRIGRNNKIFVMWKFRTLKPGGVNLEERRFMLGDFLRATSLDELPQLVNVLLGQMSLVGPRPLPAEYLKLMNDDQKVRALLPPGLTGLAQVNGRHAISWERKFEYDKYYIEHVSGWLDLKILIKTIFVVLSFKRDISLTEKPFTGD